MSQLKGFLEILKSYSDLLEQQKVIDARLAMLTPAVRAMYGTLTRVEKAKVASTIAKVKWKIEGIGLKQAVMMALDARSSEWLTPPEIRDYLESVGFNFGASGARGLTSVGTTLKRMVPEEIDAKPLAGGQIGYRSRHYDAKGLLDEEVRQLMDSLSTDDGPSLGQPESFDLPVSNPRHRIHNPPALAKVTRRKE